MRTVGKLALCYGVDRRNNLRFPIFLQTVILITAAAIFAQAQHFAEQGGGRGVDYFELSAAGGSASGGKPRKSKNESDKETSEAKVNRLFSESSVDSDGRTKRSLPPEHVRKLLVTPSIETAEEYLRAEEFKLGTIKNAMAAIEAASRKRFADALNNKDVVLYTLEGCAACEAQRQIFVEAGVTFVEKTGKNVPADVTTFPTIVVLSRTQKGDRRELFRNSGITPLEEIYSAMRRLASVEQDGVAEQNPGGDVQRSESVSNKRRSRITYFRGENEWRTQCSK